MYLLYFCNRYKFILVPHMNIQEHLIEHNIKPSMQRMAIMEYLMTHKTHPTADEIYSALAPSIPTLSKTTVYNTLGLFAKQGAALQLSIDEKNVRFDGDTSIHAHFRCIKCGKIIDFFPNQVEQLKNICLDKIGDEVTIIETQVYYKGFCKSCKAEPTNN